MTIIAKVTHKCNLNCKYCCVGEGNDGYIMSESTLGTLISTAARYCRDVTIIWHGGEPLVAGIDFYKKIISHQKMYPDCHFRNSVQTNGTLLTPELIHFFKQNNFHIGFSLDGCEMSHNINRPYKGGGASFDKVIGSMRQVEKEYNRQCGAICILNRTTAEYIDEIYKWAKTSKIRFKFNPQYRAGRAIINSDLELSNDEIAKALIKLFDLWFDDTEYERAEIIQFESFVKSITSISQGNEGSAFDCGFGKKCQNRFIAVSPHGYIYPCGKFVDEEEFKYGNLSGFDLDSYLTNPKRQEILDYSKNTGADCDSCRYKTMCNGGCPNNSFLFNGDLKHPNPFCDAYKTLFEHIENRLLARTRQHDIYIYNIESKGRYIVYSPLRHLIFYTSQSGIQAVRDYLQTGKLSSEDKNLVGNVIDMASRLPTQIVDYPIPAFRHFSFLLNSVCNLNCRYCYAKNYHGDSHLSFDQIKACVNLAFEKRRDKEQPRFTFVGGGEPLLDADNLWKSVKYIRDRSKDALIDIVTNGTIINQEIIHALKEDNVGLTVSFDILPKIQDGVRSSSYGVVAKNLHTLLSSGIVPTLRATIDRDSVNFMPQMIEHIKSEFNGIREVHIEMVDDAWELNDESFLNNYIINFEKSFLLGAKFGINVKNQLTMAIGQLRPRFCLGDVCVSPDGNLTSCQRVYDIRDPLADDYFIGHIDAEGQLKLNAEAISRVAKNFKDKNPACRSCIAQYHCAGACPHIKSKLCLDNSAYCSAIQRMTAQYLYNKHFS